ncbi:MAG TPA: hypothetical protein VJY62_12700, partial [Bacteroidia bacterium]|nr:hypothetical protein [Bacteroidia bacterium]
MSIFDPLLRNAKGVLLKFLFLQFLLFGALFIDKTHASDYYWVGGTGNWSDYANHWATTSGGLIFHIQIPGLSDNVYFDANSFTTTGQTVTTDTTFFYINDMDWTGAQFSPHFIAGNINIYGSLTLINNMFISSTILRFLSASAGNTITSAGNSLNYIYLDGAGGTWSLTGDFACNN